MLPAQNNIHTMSFLSIVLEINIYRISQLFYAATLSTAV